MQLPTRTTPEDVKKICGFLARKPGGASLHEARSVLGEKAVDVRRVQALKFWRLLEDSEHLQLAPLGRRLAQSDYAGSRMVYAEVLKSVLAYTAILERAVHRDEAAVTAADVSQHWRAYFRAETSGSDEILNEQAVSFFQLAQAAGLGQLIVGRRGAPTRFVFHRDALRAFVGVAPELIGGSGMTESALGEAPAAGSDVSGAAPDRGPAGDPIPRAILILYGAERAAAEELERLLGEFGLPSRSAAVAGDAGGPVAAGLREALDACGCAVVIVTPADVARDAVLVALGAAAYRYENRIVLLAEETVALPEVARGLATIRFERDRLRDRALAILQSLIALGVIRIVS